jgi:hypothetical protein
LQKLTLVRLELCAAELLANLFEKVNEQIDIEFTNKFLWCDSSITLTWIATPSNRLSTFVGNRVSRIQIITKNCCWKHIRSQQNPADILSRGCTPQELAQADLWWKGPLFLEESQENWPTESFKILKIIPEMKKTKISTFYVKEEDNVINQLVSQFKSTRKIQRIVAWLLRFKSHKNVKGPLTVKELWNALKVILRHLQKQCFREEYQSIQDGKDINPKSQLKCLNPFFDKNLNDGL